MRIDLHAHSSASDGTLAPGAVIDAAVQAGVDVIALTDHDTTLGWAAASAAVRAGVTLVPGAEISCSVEGISVHVLAYLFDADHPGLVEQLRRVRDGRLLRAEEIVRRLAADGYPLGWADVLAQVAPGATVGRPHIADALVAAGACANRDAVFATLLSADSPYFVRHPASEPLGLIRTVTAAGGVTVFAHPGASRRGRTVDTEVIASFADAGLAGLEVDHPDHDTPTRTRLRRLAAELGLLVTGGSDFHGAGKANRIGQETTAVATYEALVARAGGLVSAS